VCRKVPPTGIARSVESFPASCHLYSFVHTVPLRLVASTQRRNRPPAMPRVNASWYSSTILRACQPSASQFWMARSRRSKPIALRAIGEVERTVISAASSVRRDQLLVPVRRLVVHQTTAQNAKPTLARASFNAPRQVAIPAGRASEFKGYILSFDVTALAPRAATLLPSRPPVMNSRRLIDRRTLEGHSETKSVNNAG
jgi:hypothetical protein